MRFFDCHEPEPEPDSEKWSDIWSEPDTTGYLVDRYLIGMPWTRHDMQSFCK